jgi:quercetin dioxygenase-like cupin family protein
MLHTDMARQTVAKNNNRGALIPAASPVKKRNSLLQSAALTSLLAVTLMAGPVNAECAYGAKKLLSVEFASREVVKVEAGIFYFKKGQPAPVHTHEAPAIGYITKGAILYQVEGEELQLLNTGDAFYEPVGKRILRFDNASATEEAIFVDFNLQQEGEPFIVFENPPTEPIDRRALPTTILDGTNVDEAAISAHILQPGKVKELDNDEPILGYVAEGVIELRIKGKTPQRINARESFYQPKDSSEAVLVNTSSDLPAKVITFTLNDS